MFCTRHYVAPMSFKGGKIYTKLVLSSREFFGVLFGKVKQNIDIPYLREIFLRVLAVGVLVIDVLDSSFFSKSHGS